MNTSHIRSYAPKARKDFIAAITKQAAKYGITETSIAPAEVKGDLALIAGRPFPASVADARAALEQKIALQGFQVVIEQAAYSWFNRLCAIRFMELKDYLGHGRRVLSHPEHKGSFQILEDCLDIDLPGLDQTQVRALKLEGTRDEELYRKLLLAQCHALHQAMPFLFEALDDDTELLLPENLTKTDSLVRDLVDSIPEPDWDNIEIIGWLYQFYISEKKDLVIGKVVKSEDIPAATQLFTPNWIVKYMVQNSLGAQWLATYPQSPLKGQMEFYIEPAEQTDEVKAQLAAITPSELNPEELTLIDPASGSGHILVEAYELFKAIYLERGYRQRDVPQLILEKNLFGLDIDERAAQLTGFALMMKGRVDDRRLFERRVKLNVMALQDSAGFNAERLTQGVKLDDYRLQSRDLRELKRLFEHATTFGSLIQVPEGLTEKLPAMKRLSEATSQDLFVSEALKRLGPLVKQAELLAAQYDAVVANPPYMGSGYFSKELKRGLTILGYQTKRSDLYVAFLDRARLMTLADGRWSMVTRQDWMHTRSYGEFRSRHIGNTSTVNLVHLGKGAFPELSGEVVQACCMAVLNRQTGALTKFVDVTDIDGLQKREHIHDAGRQYLVATRLFPDRFGSSFMYRMTENELMALQLPAMEEEVKLREGIHTGKNDLFIRLWWEVSSEQLSDACRSIEDIDSNNARWIPYNKGGSTRRWFFDTEFVLRFDRTSRHEMAQLSGHVRPSKELYFQEGGTWSDVASRGFGVRHFPAGYLFADAGPVVVADDIFFVLALMNSKPFTELAKELMPNLHFKCGTLQKMPYVKVKAEPIATVGARIVRGHTEECCGLEAQRIFEGISLIPHLAAPPLTASSDPTASLESSYTAWITQNRDTIAEMRRLEEENNRLFIDAYGLGEELTPDVSIEQITLTVNPAYRYGGKLTEEEQWVRFRQDTMEELVSYAIGCMMGRYSLDAPGLIYAHSGNEGFDPSRYTTVPADDDGIVPLTDIDWFSDDAAHRIVEFISVAWDAAHLEDNLAFLADNLSPKRGEGSRDTIRRYLCDKFFKDHLQTYKKRPIYWLFSSGKEKAFQCLVYLHRYNEGTLARMRTEYVIPLTAKLSSYVVKLEQDRDASTATAEIKRFEKEISRLHKQQAELSAFDEKLRHHADQRIKLDLDDGVKANYGKFGDLLAEVKAITGKNPR